MLRVLLTLALSACIQVDAQQFTEQLWREALPVYRKTLEHPYLRGLSDGSLPKSKFEFYLIQDSHYLRAFGQALNVLASKAPREDWAITLGRHAVEALQVEHELHTSLLGQSGITRERIAASEVAPSNYAYTSHLLATASQGTFAEGLAAVLPCYWIYWEVGKELKKAGSKDPAYQRWIEQYAAPGYGKVVQQVLEIMNTHSARLSPDELERSRKAFVRSARYEYLFWDAAWREERWLP
jgi:thiaminase/transcriptional activator TenA